MTYEFGYGLSYGEVDYRSIEAPATVNADGTFTVTVEVANQGQEPTTEVVELYIAAKDSPYGDAAPEKQLVAFEKVEVPAVGSAFVDLTVDPKDFAVYTADNQDLTVLSGKYTLMVGRSSENILQTKDITVNGEELGALDASGRTDIFASAFAANDVYYREYSRQSTIDSLKADSVTDGYYTVVSKTAGSWVAVANVNLAGLEELTLEVAAKETSGTIEIHLDSPDGQLLATAEVPTTESTTYVLEDSDAGDFTGTTITEQAFTNVTAKLENVADLGNETLYFVFQNPELRLASFSAKTAAVAVTGVKLSQETASLTVGGTLTLTATVEPENATNQNVTWSSDNESVATVDGGKVTAVGTGTANITVTTEDGSKTATCVVTVSSSSSGGGSTGGGTSSGGTTDPGETETPDFTDVPDGTWYAEAVKWAAEEGITMGTSDTTFSPDLACTRSEIVTFLWRAAGSPAASGSMTFTDVPADSFYADAVRWAVEKGITTGTSDTTFGPDVVCTRSQMVTFLWRMAGSPAPAGEALPFTDVADGAFYADAVRWAVEEGITMGTSDTTFSPDVTCTRAQIVTVLNRYLAD